MEIEILHLTEGARQAGGTAVIIDVFRAFTTACVAAANGAERFFVTGKVQTAFRLRDLYPDCLLMGERDEQMIPGFDYGNSPSFIMDLDFKGKVVVQTTSSGTLGIVNALLADEVITGSFVNAGAVVRYVRSRKPDKLSLVCMGYAAERKTEEDTFCAEYIRNELLGIPSDYRGMAGLIRTTSGRRFFLPENQDFAPAEDFDLCLDLNRYDFMLKAERMGEDWYELVRITP